MREVVSMSCSKSLVELNAREYVKAFNDYMDSRDLSIDVLEEKKAILENMQSMLISSALLYCGYGYDAEVGNYIK